MIQPTSSSLVSIIIPTYNYGHFLADSLGSVLAQTYPHWECIVVDDGSTDDTRQIVEGFAQSDSRIKYLYQDNAGLSAARNTGLRHAKGSYLQFLDADDLLERRKLELQCAFLEDNPDTGIVYGDVRYFPDNDRNLRLSSRDGLNELWMPKVSAFGTDLLKHLINYNIMVVSAPLVRRKVVDAVGFFDEALASFEDWDYWLRCAFAGTYFSFYDPPETLAMVRYHPASLTVNTGRMLTAQLQVRKKINSQLADPELRDLNRQRSADAGVELSLLYFANNRRLAGMSAMIRYGVLGKRYDLVPYAFKCALFGR